MGDVASDEAAAADLAVVGPGCAPAAPGRAGPPVADCTDAPVADWAGVSDAAESAVAAEAASDELAAAVAGLRALERAEAISAVDDVGLSDGVAADSRAADVVLAAAALLEADEPAGADGGPEDGVPVAAGAGGGGAIQIPDSDASRVGCAQDPDVEPALVGAMGAGREPESEVDELAFEPDSGAAVEVPGVVTVAVELGGFGVTPTTGGIPKPAGEVGFAGASAPPPAESVSNGPSGSNN